MDVAGYTDLALLCRGGFSTVYRARQLAMDRLVALKVLDLALTDQQARDRFQRECAAAGRVGAHPAIVTVHDCGFTDDGRPFLSMELCEGGSLSDLLRGSGPLPMEQVLRIGVAIAGALAYAHNAGVLPRDVKPGNILLTGFGEPVLTDFGIAALDGHALSTQTSTSFTVAHAAPECLAGQPSSRASDLYSLSSTLFTLLAGHPPFQVDDSASPVALAVKVIDSPVPRLPRDDVPDSLVALLETGMSKRPDRRPVDVSVFGHELQRIQAECGYPVTEWVTVPGQEGWAESPAIPAAGVPVPGQEGWAESPAIPAAGVPVEEPAPLAAVSPEVLAGGGLAAAFGSAGPAGAATAAVPAADLPPRQQRPGPSWSAAAVGVTPARGPDPGESPPAVPLDPLQLGVASPPPRRAPAWTAAAAVALLVIAGAAVFVFRLASAGGPSGRGNGLPQADAAEPTTSGTATGSTTGAAGAHALPDITSLSSAGGTSPTVTCPSPDTVATVDLIWRASNANTAWLAIDGGPDASVHPLRSALPPTVGPGNPKHPVEQVPFDCSAPRHTYTLTVMGPGGKVSQSLVYLARQAPGSASTGANAAADRASVLAESRQGSISRSTIDPSRSTTSSVAGSTPVGTSRSATTPVAASSAPSDGDPGTPPATSTPAPSTSSPAPATSSPAPATSSPAPATSSPPAATSSTAPATTSEQPTSDGSTGGAGTSASSGTDPTTDPASTDSATSDAVTGATAAPTSGSADAGAVDVGSTTTSGPTTDVSADAV